MLNMVHSSSHVDLHAQKQHTRREFVYDTGSWQSFKSPLSENVSETKAALPGSKTVPSDAKSPQGYPCPWAGQSVGRSTKCPATRKSFKACCGKRYSMNG